MEFKSPQFRCASECKRTLPIAEFGYSRSQGFSRYCKQCRRRISTRSKRRAPARAPRVPLADSNIETLRLILAELQFEGPNAVSFPLSRGSSEGAIGLLTVQMCDYVSAGVAEPITLVQLAYEDERLLCSLDFSIARIGSVAAERGLIVGRVALEGAGSSIMRSDLNGRFHIPTLFGPAKAKTDLETFRRYYVEHGVSVEKISNQFRAPQSLIQYLAATLGWESERQLRNERFEKISFEGLQRLSAIAELRKDEDQGVPHE